MRLIYKLKNYDEKIIDYCTSFNIYQNHVLHIMIKISNNRIKYNIIIYLY